MTINKLVVALPTSTFLPATGGVEVGLHNIASSLLAEGHRPIVIAPATNVRQIQRSYINLPYKLLPMPPKTIAITQTSPAVASFLLSIFFRFLQQRYRFDVWHGTVGFPIGVALARFAQNTVPHIIRCAGEDIQIDRDLNYGMRLNPTVDQLIRKWLPRADALSAITESMAQEYAKIDIRTEQIWKIPNGVDLKRFQVQLDPTPIRKEFGICPDAFLYLSVGRHHPKKGFTDLINATALLKKMVQEPFIVAIAGKNTEELRAQVAEKGLNEHIKLLGEFPVLGNKDSALQAPSNRLIALYKSADAFVFPSHIESFGIALIEAMAASLPVITTDGPGCRDLIADGRYGMMVPAEDRVALARAMNQFLSNKHFRTTYIHMAEKRALEFSWQSIARQYIEAYRTIIERRRT